MDVLFTTFGELSLRGGDIRPVAMLRALVDAGHRIDIVAARADLPGHAQVRILAGGGCQAVSRAKVVAHLVKAVALRPYQAVHAVDSAALLAGRPCLLKKVPLVYDAGRRFGGLPGTPPSLLGRIFPGRLLQAEKRLLETAAAIFCPDETLASDLRALVPQARIVEIQHVPAQPLFPGAAERAEALLGKLGLGPSSVVVACRMASQKRCDLRTVMLAVRKVVESIPPALFFFRGIVPGEAASLAASLAISDHCVFLAPGQAEEFVAAVGRAAATLFVPQPGSRYIHPEVFTLLNARAPLVAMQDRAGVRLLDDVNSVQVLSSPELVAEGLVRAVQEPLFSNALATAGQQLVADRHAFSSLKHKVRMAYNGLAKKE